MKGKRWVFLVLFLIVLLLSPRLYVLGYGAWQYFHTEETCLSRPVPILITDIRTISVDTNLGTMYPGDEQGVYGEGVVFGLLTLLSVDRQGATFVVDYRSGKEYRVCRWRLLRDEIESW